MRGPTVSLDILRKSSLPQLKLPQPGGEWTLLVAHHHFTRTYNSVAREFVVLLCPAEPDHEQVIGTRAGCGSGLANVRLQRFVIRRTVPSLREFN